MSLKTIRDPKGGELFPTLIQVLEHDAQGRPSLCQVRHDDETLALGEIAEDRRVFIIAWCNSSSHFTASDVLSDLTKAAASCAEARDLVGHVCGERDAVIADYKRVYADCEQKTQALRELQRERDPERVNAMVRDAVAQATERLEESVRVRNATIADMERQLAELRASKRKLKEANDRLKEAQKR